MQFRTELCQTTGYADPEEMLAEWDGWMWKVLKVGKMEDKRATIKKLLGEYDAVPSSVIYEAGKNIHKSSDDRLPLCCHY